MVQLPPIRVPALARLDDIFDPGSSEENLISEAAKQQIEEERGEESLFWKVLEMIGRPQHAVAGVMKDLIDGRDFSPFDRIGQALAGNEKYRIKDFIDIISPGNWSRMKLPDFLGGKEADVTKEVVGFLGDIFTDPLMATRTFTLMKGFHPITGEHINTLAYWDKLAKGRIFGKAAEGARKMVGSKALANQVGTSFLHRKDNMLKLKGMWLDAMRDPDDFMRTYIPKNKMFEFAEGIEPYLGKKFAAPTIAAQFAERQRSIASFVTPFAKSLGIKPEQFSLIPKFADDLASALSKGISTLYEGVATSPAGNAFLNTVHTMFRSGTGNKGIDYWGTITASLARRAGQTAEDHVNNLKRIMGHRTDDEMREIMQHAEQPMKDWGLRPREFGEKFEDIPEEFREPVEQLWEYFDELHRVETENPLLRYQGITRSPWSLEKAHRIMREELKRDHPTLAKNFKTFSKLKQDAERATKKLQKTHKMSPEDARKVEAEMLDDLAAADRARGAAIAGRSIPGRPLGYVPHEIEPKAWSVFMDLFRNPAITFGANKLQMHDYVMKEMTHRVPGMRELTAKGLNEALNKGQLDWNLLQSFHDQVLTKLGSKDRTKWEWFLGQMDGDQLNFWIEDPIQLYALRAQKSINAVRKADFLRGAIRATGRRLQLNDNPTPFFGETTAILSKEGMEAFYGPAWRREIGGEAAEAYDALLASRRLDADNTLGGVYLNMSHNDIALAHGQGVPVFGIPTADLEDIARTFTSYNDPKSWNTFLRGFDEVTNWFKATSLAIFPAYHARNVLSGFWQAHLGDTLNPAAYQDAFKFLAHGGNWKSGFPKSAQDTVEKVHQKIFGRPSLAKPLENPENLAMDLGGGVLYTYEKQLEDMHKFGVFTGIYATEMKEAGRRGVLAAQPGAAKTAALQLTQYGTPIKTGFAVGNYFDNVHRIAHYRAKIGQGNTPFEAAMSVKKYFFDYDELTQFERNWLRRFALPFFTWSRKNIPLQLEAIATQPGKYGNLGRAVEWFQSDEAKQMDRTLLPKWVHEQFGVPTRINKKTGDVEVMMLRSWIPAMDLMAVVHQNPVHAAMRTVTALGHPIPKGLMEQHVNQSFFTGKKIEEFPGEPYPGGFLGVPASKRFVHFAKTFRLPSEIERIRRSEMLGAKLTASQRLAGASGLVPKIKAFDVERLGERLKFDIAKRKGELRRKLNTAKKFKDPILIKYYKDLLEDASAGSR